MLTMLTHVSEQGQIAEAMMLLYVSFILMLLYVSCHPSQYNATVCVLSCNVGTVGRAGSDSTGHDGASASSTAAHHARGASDDSKHATASAAHADDDEVRIPFATNTV